MRLAGPDDYESRREARREDERHFQSDVAYDVWRSGGNPDAIDRDQVSDDFRDGLTEDDSVARAMHAQRPRHDEPEEQIQEEP